MLCALTVRQLQPGSFDQFVEAFSPSQDDGPPAGWVRFDLIRDVADENRVVTFGFFDGTLEQLEGSQVDHGYEARREAANQYVADVPVNGVFEVVVDMSTG
jgi:heme-degrading monooxygenase HmoA